MLCCYSKSCLLLSEVNHYIYLHRKEKEYFTLVCISFVVGKKDFNYLLA